MNIQIYNGLNSQEVVLTVTDLNNNPVTGVTITATLQRGGVVLTGSNMTFTGTGTAGSYSATLNGFDAPAGAAQMVVSGSSAGLTVNDSIFTTIAQRTL